MADFASFFKNDGVFYHFFQEFINPFIETNQSSWKWLTINGEVLSENNSTPEKLHNVMKVSAYLFPNNSQQPDSIPFKLKPITLSDNAASVSFNIGTQSLLYRHGPLQNFDFVWSMADNSNIKINFTNFNGKDFNRLFSGQWGLVKMLMIGNLRKSNDSYGYNLKFSLDDFDASFDLIVGNNNAFNAMLLLSGLDLPQIV
jgi:type VI secretion system protein ImpL